MDHVVLSNFIVKAKRRTYAALDDDATISPPILRDSKQLEYNEHDLRYRDIYFGLAFFVGQETVVANERVIWSMSYAGGVSLAVTDHSRFLAIYAFLRQALLNVREDQPFRGPSRFEDGDFSYLNTSEGDISNFHGAEQILLGGTRVHGVRYAGGIIR